MTKQLVCPKCGYPQICGCNSCITKLPEGIKPYKWDEHDCISCGNCGFTMHVDQWMDEEIKQFADELDKTNMRKK